MAAPRTQFYHPAPGIEAALQAVERTIRRAEGVAIVVGPPGTGKSLLLAKVAENVRDDFDCALLSGARICTRRALWQSILAAIGEPYRGIGESDLRMAVIDRVRQLGAAGSGLVILVDEAHTLPTRLLEELRLLASVPTPFPAVHVILAGSSKLEETLGLPRLESLAQRIAARAYLEPLDHAETGAYLRTQSRIAGLAWDRLFATGCDDAVFTATDGVPRLINLLCDQALLIAGEGGRVTPADIATAWGEIQRLPLPAAIARSRMHAAEPAAADPHVAPPATGERGADDGPGVIEFGSLVEETATRVGGGRCDPWDGPDVELIFEEGGDPFEEFFEHEERVVERFLVGGPHDFRGHPPVTSGSAPDLGRLLAEFDREAESVPAIVGSDAAAPAARHSTREPAGRAAAVREAADPLSGFAAEEGVEEADEDADMVVIEEDIGPAGAGFRGVCPVPPRDFRSLFTRLRRGTGGG